MGSIHEPECTLRRLCYEDRLLPLFADLGFKWTIIDDSIMTMHGITIPDHEILRVNKVSVFMRSSFWSNQISQPVKADPAYRGGPYLTGREFVRRMRSEVADQDYDCYKIIALSGEAFGHHIKYYQETFLRDVLFELLHTPTVRLCRVSDLLHQRTLSKRIRNKGSDKQFMYFPPSSWAVTPEDYEPSYPYPQWKSHGNIVHEKLWKLADVIFEACEGLDFENDAHSTLRGLLDCAFYCTLYHSASTGFWEPDEIYAGIDLQMRALYTCARLTDNHRLLEEGQSLYKELMWEIHKQNQEIKR